MNVAGSNIPFHDNALEVDFNGPDDTDYVSKFCSQHNIPQAPPDSKEHEVILDAVNHSQGILKEVIPSGKENDQYYCEVHARLFYHVHKRLPRCYKGDPARITCQPRLKSVQEQRRQLFLPPPETQQDTQDSASTTSEITTHTATPSVDNSRMSGKRGRGRPKASQVSPEDATKKRKEDKEMKRRMEEICKVEMDIGWKTKIKEYIYNVVWHHVKFVASVGFKKQLTEKVHDNFFPEGCQTHSHLTEQCIKEHKENWVLLHGNWVVKCFGEHRNTSQRQHQAAIVDYCKVNILADTDHKDHRDEERDLPSIQDVKKIVLRDLPIIQIDDPEGSEEKVAVLDMTKAINQAAVFGYYGEWCGKSAEAGECAALPC